MSTGSTFFLNEEEINKLINSAEKGDSESAFKLYRYYFFSSLEEEKAFLWLKISAFSGHLIGLKNYAKLVLMKTITFEKNEDLEFILLKLKEFNIIDDSEISWLISELEKMNLNKQQ